MTLPIPEITAERPPVSERVIDFLVGQFRATVEQFSSEYVDNPAGWVKDRLGEHAWSRQREIMESVRDHRRTAVRSCHSAGKSWTASRIAAWWIESHPPGEAFVVTSATAWRQVRAVLWKEINRCHARGNLNGRTNQTEWWMKMPAGNEEIVAFGHRPSDTDPTAFQGVHARYVLVIFDEAGGIPAILWDAADSLISNEDSRFLAIGNPDDPTSHFAEVCKPGSGWNVIGVSAFDTPNFTGEEIPESMRHLLVSKIWVEEKRRTIGEDSPIYKARVLGEFPDVTSDGLIPIKWITAAQHRDLEGKGAHELGVDVGAGGDRSVIGERKGPVFRIIHRDQNPDTMETCGVVLRILKETGAKRAKVDKIGIGQGVVDRAKELIGQGQLPSGVEVEGINVGQSASDKEQFVNLRAEGYWGLRERFQDGTMDIDPNDDDLAHQLVQLKYKRTSAGKIQIESKDQMKRRLGGQSPDDADCCMLAFVEPPPPEPVMTKATW